MSTPKSDFYLPEPDLILLGCRPWDSLTPTPCPVCKQGVRAGDDTSYCARCDSMSPKREAQVCAARSRDRTKQQHATAARNAQDAFDQLRQAAPLLTEVQRRRIWMGYSRSGINSRNPDVVNRAKVGRDWLTAIGQEPDWSIELDASGRPKTLAARAG